MAHRPHGPRQAVMANSAFFAALVVFQIAAWLAGELQEKPLRRAEAGWRARQGSNLRPRA